MCSSKCWFSLYSWCTSTQHWTLTSPFTDPGSAHTSASTSGTLWAMSSHIQTLLLSQTDTQASLEHASCFTRAVRYLHRGLSHSGCGPVPQSSKRWLESEWESRGGEGRGGEKREGGGEELSGNDAFVGKWLELLAVGPILLYMV